MASPSGYTPVKIAPGVDKPNLIGFMRTMIKDPVRTIPPAAYRQPITVLSMAGSTLAYICDPDALEEILVRRVADFPKSQVDDRILRPALGDSLLTAHGEDWRWKRRLAAPYFAPAALARLVPDMVAPFQAFADDWRRRNDGVPIDVSPAMTAATFEVISRTLFSKRGEADFTAISEAITDYLAPISWVIGFASLKLPAWTPHPGRLQILRARDRMRAVVGKLVSARRKSSDAQDDICGDLMRARDPETQRPLDDEDVIDMLLTLIAAGHETSANGLTWALYCLAEQPALQAELAAEVRRVVGARPVGAADLPALATVEAFIKETMRLLPPVPLLSRMATKPEKLGGHELAPGTLLFIPVYAIQRHERLWQEPDRFDLTRFLGENARRIPRTAFMPFGAGPRVCVGGTFAMMEMVAGLTTLIQHVRFAAVEGARYEPIQRVTLRPKGGLPLKVAPSLAA
ncbi:MAG: cytochrome P450 [Alphaproteobacteria bacterium]